MIYYFFFYQMLAWLLLLCACYRNIGDTDLKKTAIVTFLQKFTVEILHNFLLKNGIAILNLVWSVKIPNHSIACLFTSEGFQFSTTSYQQIKAGVSVYVT